MRKLVLALPLLLAFFSAGCGTPEIIDPIFDVPSDKTLIVVPFRDEEFHQWMESPRGTELAQRVTKILAEKADFKVMPVEAMLALYDSEAKNPRELTPQEICDQTGADYLLLGDVRVWQLHDPGAINLFRGTSVVDVTVFQSNKAMTDTPKEKRPKKGRAVKSAEVAALFPKEFGLEDVGTPMVGHDAALIEAGLKSQTAIKVAELMYGHAKEESHLAQD